jgi:aspartate carbamoyltransferase catalytic subunit
MKHLISASAITKSEIDKILQVAADMLPVARKEVRSDVLKDFLLASLFYEPSTRTRLSFETAMQRLGGRVISVTGKDSSSLSKGETLSDTAKVISQFADIMVIRHSEEGSAAEFSSNASVPVINAGDGSGEHPTQALLDIFTIMQERKNIIGLTIALVGDLKYGRTVHSLTYLLEHFGVNLIFVSPDQLGMPKENLDRLKEKNIQYRETENIEEALKNAEIVYMTRIQKERFSDPDEYLKYKNCYVLTKEIIEKYNPSITIMHPLPRVGEISLNVDELPGAAYFRQVQNGVALRMALLQILLGK